MNRKTFVRLVFSMWCLHCITYVKTNSCAYYKLNSINYISKATFTIYNTKNCHDIGTYLEHMRIKFVYNDTFNGMHNLRNISLSYNLIKTLDIVTFRDTWNINNLYLSNNQIELIKTGLFSNLSHLEYLVISYNKLQSVELNLFADLKSLTNLNLQHNFITELDKNIFRYNPNLELLDLSFNRIIHVDVALFQNKLKLRNVHLNNNKIKYIQDGLFTNLKQLTVLLLSDNSIHNISKNAFPVSSTLWLIDVSSNQLEHLDANLFNKLTGLKSLELYNNTWLCDYRLKNLYAIYTKFNSSQEPICNQPIKLRNQTWNSLNQFDFQSFDIQSYQVHLNEDNTTFSCYIEADPVLSVTWYHNNDLLDEEISHQSNHSYEFTKEDLGNGTLVFYLTVSRVDLKEMDTFSCHAAVEYEMAHRVFSNFIKTSESIIHTQSLFVGLSTSILLITLVIAIVAFSYWIRMKFKEAEPDLNDFREKEMYELLEEHKANKRFKQQANKNNRV